MENNLLKGKVRHVDKLVEIQKKLLEERAKKMKFWKKKRTTLLVIALTPLMRLPCVKGCKVLEAKVEYLLKKLFKFTMGKDNLEALLGQQKCAIEKPRLGYTYNKKQKAYKNFFNFTKASSSPFTVCHYCMNKGHSSFKCMIKRYGVPSGKYKWVPKGTKEVANQKGPNTIWVPKSTF